MLRFAGSALAPAEIHQILEPDASDSIRAGFTRTRTPSMIELTAAQAQTLAHAGPALLTVTDPTTHTTYVLVRQDEYEQWREYDDSPWTDEEMDGLAAEVDALLDDDLALEDAPV